MRIAIIALGSRGDVQPYVALGKGLQADGHAVRLITHQNYEELVGAHGLPFWPVQGNVQAFVETEEMRALVDKGNFLALAARTAKEAKRAAVEWARDALAACGDVDLLLGGFGGLTLGLALGEKLERPFIQAYLVPFTPTSAFPGALLPPVLGRLGGAANRLSHHLTRQAMWQQMRPGDRLARRQVLDLPAAPFWGPFKADALRRTPILYGFSPSVIAKPDDWPADAHVTGYWFLDSAADWRPPPALAAFLEDGPPPVTIGFGSMGLRRPAETAALILEALAQTGQRAVILSGWGGLRQATLPASVFVIDAAPHDWLFPQAAAVVHHGGAGTTAAGLRAGVPSIVVPFFGDQPFWGQRVADLGVGPGPIARRKLTADRLAAAIRQAVTDGAMRQRAAALGAQIRSEDGVGRATAVIREFVERAGS